MQARTLVRVRGRELLPIIKTPFHLRGSSLIVDRRANTAPVESRSVQFEHRSIAPLRLLMSGRRPDLQILDNYGRAGEYGHIGRRNRQYEA